MSQNFLNTQSTFCICHSDHRTTVASEETLVIVFSDIIKIGIVSSHFSNEDYK